ncbi:acetyl-CoA C-acyltransferase FadA [Bremerella alba]|uniref:acetyl-CoA C-acyltransferase n=1 Tax=Bremerella alba TaxID=980252 RepID=A0A7V8V9R0_9BACT|nr:acetyl-CoA C-acyltransferase FadA [Bremerella alba]MBA2117538.1 3-ketoacyl-CoA thiolase [Bremerella alba]
MNQAVIIDCLRTSIGRAHPERGYYRDVRSDDLAVHCVQALIERTGIDPNEIEDVLFGNTQQTLEQGLNVARIIALTAGLPVTAAGTTINRLCGSSLQALNQAAHSIIAGGEDVQIVGGLEHMTHVPMDHAIDVNPKLYHHTSEAALHMGITAEFLAQTQGISRQDQDEFALASHQKASAAIAAGKFNQEIIPTHGRDEEGQRKLLTIDQCVREDTSLEALSALRPVFMPDGGTVTAGNASPINDGASAMLVMSDTTAKRWDLKPMARVVATAVAGVEPSLMGTGPIPATQKALKRAGMTLDQIDVIELNEAFAAQSLACIRALELDMDKVNVHGGAIAIGHPLGCSGARISTTLLHAMQDRDARFGLATMCIGVGQGIATIFERLD